MYQMSVFDYPVVPPRISTLQRRLLKGVKRYAFQ